jgi:hypothetical protein
MNTTTAGLLTGLALGFAGYFGGFGALVVVAVVGLAGLAVGYLVRSGGRARDYLRSREDEQRRGTERRRPSSAGGGGLREAFSHRESGTSAAPPAEHKVRVQ